jgi:hypothetical protein
MLKLMTAGAMLALAGCSMAPQPPPIVSWQYGAGNGDGVQYQGDKPTFARAYGLGGGDSVTSGQVATTQYSYGAENQSGSMVQVAPPRQMLAAPAPQPNQPQAVPGTHS